MSNMFSGQSLVDGFKQKLLLHTKAWTHMNMSHYKEVKFESTKTCANICVFWFMAFSHHRKRDPTSVPVHKCGKLHSVLTSYLLVTYSAHVKHIQLKPTKLNSHTTLVKLQLH